MNRFVFWAILALVVVALLVAYPSASPAQTVTAGAYVSYGPAPATGDDSVVARQARLRVLDGKAQQAYGDAGVARTIVRVEATKTEVEVAKANAVLSARKGEFDTAKVTLAEAELAVLAAQEKLDAIKGRVAAPAPAAGAVAPPDPAAIRLFEDALNAAIARRDTAQVAFTKAKEAFEAAQGAFEFCSVQLTGVKSEVEVKDLTYLGAQAQADQTWAMVYSIDRDNAQDAQITAIGNDMKALRTELLSKMDSVLAELRCVKGDMAKLASSLTAQMEALRRRQEWSDAETRQAILLLKRAQVCCPKPTVTVHKHYTITPAPVVEKRYVSYNRYDVYQPAPVVNNCVPLYNPYCR